MTIRDIAQICNVSISTVSRAMNDAPGINAQTREKVLKVVRELGYVPNNSARNLKRVYSHTIALLIKGYNNPFFQSMLPFFQKEFQGSEYQYIIQFMREDGDEILEAEQLVKEKRLRGIIFLGGSVPDPMTVIQRIQVPSVFCSVANAQEDTAGSLPVVSIDDEQEAAQAVDYLCRRGHRRIAIIAGRPDDTTVGRRRLGGYRRALEENGIAFDEDLVGYMRPDIPQYTEANAYAVASDLLSRDLGITAFFVISDRMSMGVYKAIYDQGKQIPEDYSVVGFDGIEASMYMTPALTTMAQPGEEMVRSSIEILLDQIEGKKAGGRIVYPAKLLKRKSVRDL